MGRIRYILAAILIGVVALGANILLMSQNVGWPSIWMGGSQIICPVDNSPYVWTPIWSANSEWKCLTDGHKWKENYPPEVYEQWRRSLLSPEYVRDYTVLYLRQIEGKALPDPLTVPWTGGIQRVELNLTVTYAYHGQGLVVTIGYPWIWMDAMKYTIRVQEEGAIVWEGQLYLRQFIPNCGACKIHP